METFNSPAVLPALLAAGTYDITSGSINETRVLPTALLY
jgi:hypothetical protein